MPNHIYDKDNLIRRLEAYLGKTFEEIDNKGMFKHVQDFNLQKGIAGSIVEQCIFEYPPDTKQEADLIIVDGRENVKTELKTTGMLIRKNLGDTMLRKSQCQLRLVAYMTLRNKNLKHRTFGKSWNTCLLSIIIMQLIMLYLV